MSLQTMVEIVYEPFMNSDISQSYVYMLCNRHKNVIYVGCTDDLKKRVYFHKKQLMAGFTKKYNVDRLIYFEKHASLDRAMKRET